MNLNPRKTFQSSPHAKKHVELVLDESFRRAVEASLLEYNQLLTAGNEPANFYRMKGATEFAHVLLNIAEPLQPRKTDRTQNLNHNA